MPLSMAFDDITLLNPSNWRDTTHELDADSAPLTLTKPDGVGALQFSLALYEGGKVPTPTTEKLLELAIEFGQLRGFSESSATGTSDEPLLRLAWADYESEGDFIRVWYASDGSNFAMITYVCALDELDEEELDECQRIARSLRFISESSRQERPAT